VKLSARDKQRLQWALAVFVGSAGVLYACIHLLIRPLMQVRAEGLTTLNDYQQRISKATTDLRGLPATRAEVAKLHAELAIVTNRFVMRPVLGSTLVSVQGVVEPIARACDLQLESCVERGRMDVPVSRKDAVFVIDRYLVEISAVGSFAAVRDFVQALEQTNEFVCVTDAEIIGLAGDVFRHKVRICMEWPVFGERSTAAEAAPRADGGTRKEVQP